MSDLEYQSPLRVALDLITEATELARLTQHDASHCELLHTLKVDVADRLIRAASLIHCYPGQLNYKI
jgi:hypothetical protein